MSKRFAMAVDSRRCVGCNACVIACKAENAVPLGGFRCWVTQQTQGSFPHLQTEIRSERCNHCADPICVTVCPTGASWVAEGGIVAVDRDKCTGCRACIAGCPFDARYVHPEGFVDKCSFCLHRVRKGLLPACVANCPAGALTFGDLAEPAGELTLLLRRRRHRTLGAHTGLSPQVFYLTDGAPNAPRSR
jgi:tetrathionate reductase subunit B